MWTLPVQMALIKLSDGAAGLLWQAAYMREAVILTLLNLSQILFSLCFVVAFSTAEASSGVTSIFKFSLYDKISANCAVNRSGFKSSLSSFGNCCSWVYGMNGSWKQLVTGNMTDLAPVLLSWRTILSSEGGGFSIVLRFTIPLCAVGVSLNWLSRFLFSIFAEVICVYDAIYWNGMFIDNYIFYNMDSSYDDSLLLYDGSASVFHWDALIK